MERSCGFECRCVSNLVKRKVCESDITKQFAQLTGIQSFAINYLYTHKDEEIYQKDFETKFTMRRSTATQVLSLMERNGLIERRLAEDDGRKKKIVLTQKAIEIHKAMERVLADIERQLRCGIDAKQLEIFFEVIDKIKQNLSEKRCEEK
ncbi:MAG: MarR family transcriptional regulator [Corallococcus sp.]|nr:MarR family transcriptional regulator [Corallococcus sp.]